MTFLKRHKSKIVIIIFILFSIFIIMDSSNLEKNEVKEDVSVKKETKKETKKEENKKVLVDVKGQVNNPGVYESTEKNTVMDVINQAGGLTNKSDTSNINLSKKLEDEMVIIVYSKEEIRQMKVKQTSCPNYNNACIDNKDEKSNLENSNTKSDNKTELVNINTADEEKLQTLSGIGASKAKAIIEYRNTNGKFEKIEDIKNVSGIGDSAFEKIKDYITT